MTAQTAMELGEVATGPGYELRCGDCRELMAAMPEASVDAVCTDPPYGLGFMSRDWDHEVPGPECWAEALRVAKPGAHLVAFGGTRCWHRLACAIEDAGWEIRDTLSWLYGSGFPKNLDVSRAGSGEQWAGWGTALKPAYEPIILARKPLDGTVASNVTEHGTGAINVDGCRVGKTVETWPSSRAYGAGFVPGGDRTRDRTQATGDVPAGRWPANLILDPEAAAMLDGQSGESVSSARARHNTAEAHNRTQSMGKTSGDWVTTGFSDTGGASRFFYVAKASRREREAGLHHRAPTNVNDGRAPSIDNPYQRGDTQRRNTHPTVKPVSLMRWLVRLVTPPGGVVIDPFTGSGSTGMAAVLEGFGFIGCELSEEYVEIARTRIANVEADPDGWMDVLEEEPEPSQLSIMDRLGEDTA